VDSLIHEARSEWRHWRGPVEDVFTLNGVNNAANQDKLCCRLFVAVRRFIRELLLIVHEMPELTAYNSRSIQLQAEEFFGGRLDGNKWRAKAANLKLTFATALPSDEMGVVIQKASYEHGPYFLEFDHTRESLLFRPLCDDGPCRHGGGARRAVVGRFLALQ
jgi:hypothetical protein